MSRRPEEQSLEQRAAGLTQRAREALLERRRGQEERARREALIRAQQFREYAANALQQATGIETLPSEWAYDYDEGDFRREASITLDGVRLRYEPDGRLRHTVWCPQCADDVPASTPGITELADLGEALERGPAALEEHVARTHPLPPVEPPLPGPLERPRG